MRNGIQLLEFDQNQQNIYKKFEVYELLMKGGLPLSGLLINSPVRLRSSNVNHYFLYLYFYFSEK